MGRSGSRRFNEITAAVAVELAREERRGKREGGRERREKEGGTREGRGTRREDSGEREKREGRRKQGVARRLLGRVVGWSGSGYGVRVVGC